MTLSAFRRTSLFLFLPSLVLFGCGANEASRLHGEWTGTDQLGQTMRLDFRSDGTLVLNVSGRQTFRKTGKFNVDFSQSPAHLNIELNDGRAVNTIIELDGDTLLLENVNSSDERPTSFGSNKITFSRVSET